MLFLFIIGSFAEIYSIGNLENATAFARLHNLVHLKTIHEYDVFEGTLINMKRLDDLNIFTDFRNGIIEKKMLIFLLFTELAFASCPTQ